MERATGVSVFAVRSWIKGPVMAASHVVLNVITTDDQVEGQWLSSAVRYIHLLNKRAMLRDLEYLRQTQPACHNVQNCIFRFPTLTKILSTSSLGRTG
jgi:hypothetical protein